MTLKSERYSKLFHLLHLGLVVVAAGVMSALLFFLWQRVHRLGQEAHLETRVTALN